MIRVFRYQKTHENFTVYKHLCMGTNELEELKKYISTLISIDTFLLTTTQHVYTKQQQQQKHCDKGLVQLEMIIDGSNQTKPFIILSNTTVLLSMGTIFQIKSIEKVDRQIWVVKLIMNDILEKKLNEKFKDSNFQNTLVDYLLTVGEYEKAEEYCKLLFNEISSLDRDYISKINSNLGLINHKKGNYDLALKYFVRAFEIRPDSKFISITYENNGDSGQAKEYFDNSQNLGEYNSLLLNADTYSTIGSYYGSKGEYDDGLFNYHKAFVIQKRLLPSNHPSLAITLNNIAYMYYKLGQFSDAFKYTKLALNIQLISLSPDDPDIVLTYNNFGHLSLLHGDYSIKILEYLTNARDISLETGQPGIGYIYSNIALYYKQNKDYSTALINYKKTLEFELEIDYATLDFIYYHLGSIYVEIDDYVNGIKYLSKTFDIQSRTQQNSNSLTAARLSNIAEIYKQVGDYDMALKLSKKALEILFITSPADLLSISQIYSDIGTLYSIKLDYESALKHTQLALSYFHFMIADTYESVAVMYHENGDYDTVVLNLNKALDIQLNIQPQNYSVIVQLYFKIGTVHEQRKDYRSAIIAFEQTLYVYLNFVEPKEDKRILMIQNRINFNKNSLKNEL
ncbi:unnamed protein product [Didymodactylos carnosus]|uniref:Uncharacterized protein n=1 Tax=Didymodactylos carnosus TaxID=1234261 RepID=A0A814X206_9BILA|nr:unnamed protein product [Didymodactylos carnosus]CAF3973230.1 unnamed protein product [Didymodactylos carnosus]